MMRRADRRRGAAALELALVLPLLLGFVLMLLDLANLVSQWQRVSAAAAAAADLAARLEPGVDPKASKAGRDLGALAKAASMAAHPAPLLEQGGITITSLAEDAGGPAVIWQQSWGAGAKPDLSAAMAMHGVGALVQVDVTLTVRPWRLSGGLLGRPGRMQLHQRAIRRLGAPLQVGG